MLEAMQRAAAGGDEMAFIEAYRATNWEAGTVEEFVAAIKLAFRAGAFRVAGELARKGAAKHPADATLCRYAELLAHPPQITDVPASR